MALQTTTINDTVNFNRPTSARYAKQNREKIEARRLVRQNCHLNDSCEFCGATEKLEFHHFAGYRYWWIFVTACKQCHEWADKKHKDTWKGDNRLTLAQFKQFTQKLNRYDEFFDSNGKPRDSAMLKQLKPIKVYYPHEKRFEVRYG